MKFKKLVHKKLKRLKKVFHKKNTLFESISRISLFVFCSFVLWIKMIEAFSNKLFELILLTPDLTIITKIQDSAYFFFL